MSSEIIITEAAGKVVAGLTGLTVISTGLFASGPDPTGVEWIDRILGPLGTLVLCLIAIYFLVQWISSRLSLSDKANTEHAAELVKLVKEVTTIAATSQEVIRTNTQILEQVHKELQKQSS